MDEVHKNSTFSHYHHKILIKSTPIVKPLNITLFCFCLIAYQRNTNQGWMKYGNTESSKSHNIKKDLIFNYCVCQKYSQKGKLFIFNISCQTKGNEA